MLEYDLITLGRWNSDFLQKLNDKAKEGWKFVTKFNSNDAEETLVFLLERKNPGDVVKESENLLRSLGLEPTP